MSIFHSPVEVVSAYSIMAMWFAWLAYWVSAARGVKAVRRSESTASRMTYFVPLALAILLFMHPRLMGIAFAARVFPRSLPATIGATVCVALGLALSVWARRVLAGNWSGTVTVKHQHELIRGGPYRRVRHPIYTGLLLAALGTAASIDRWSALVAVALMAASFIRKIFIEERFLIQHFGVIYRQYQRETARLVPYVW